MNRLSIDLESLEHRRFLSVSPLVSSGNQADTVPGIFVPIFKIPSPKPTQGGVTLTEKATQQFTAKIGEFTYKTVDQALNANINWGDGTHSEGKLVGSYATGEYYVQGTHTYAHAGTYKVDVKILAHLVGSPIHPTGPVAEFTSVITANPLKPTNGGVTLHETAGQKFTAQIGEFTYKTVDQALNAVINWGDGTQSDGKLVGSYATGEYYVQGTHTYAHVGTYKVDVNVFAHLIGSPMLPAGTVAEFTSVIKTTSLKPSAGGVTLTETTGKNFTAKLGEFTYKTIDQVLNAVVDWGDGTQSVGKLVGSYATGEYYVQGTHQYAKAGTFKVGVKIFGHPAGSSIHPTGALAQFTSVIKVNDKA